MRARSLLAAGIFATASVALACLFVDGPVAGVAFGIVTLSLPPALVALAVSHNGRVGPLRFPLIGFAALLQGCFLAMLLLSGRGEPEERWLGLPPAAVVMVFGLGLAVLVFVSLVYARYFQRCGVREEDLRRIRELARGGKAGS